MSFDPLRAAASLAATLEPHSERILRAYLEQDRKLVAKGFPATSVWWLDTITRFYRARRRKLVARVGRRGGKSSTVSRVAVCEALHGQHKIPPGDVGVVAFVSVDRAEAANRIRTVTAILDALGVAWRPCERGVALVDRPIEFRVHTASIAGVSGFTSVFVVLDEMAKWRDRDTGANPATEVLASIAPTMATQRNASLWMISSPYATVDAHFDAFERGETADQIVASAPTWVANPSLTMEETRALEPDERRWRREYGAIPQTELETAMFTRPELELVTRAEPADLPPEPGVTYVAAMDPATRRNAWTLVIAGMRRRPDWTLVRSVVLARQWQGTRAQALDPDAVLGEIATLCRPYGLRGVWSDEFGPDALAAIARRHEFSVWPEMSTKKVKLFTDLHARMLDGEIELAPHSDLRRDLLSVLKVITRTGPQIVYQCVDERHADFAPAVAMALEKATTAPSLVEMVPPEGSPEWQVWMAKKAAEKMRKESVRRFARKSDVW